MIASRLSTAAAGIVFVRAYRRMVLCVICQAFGEGEGVRFVCPPVVLISCGSGVELVAPGYMAGSPDVDYTVPLKGGGITLDA